ncbi:MAG: HYR domain-containing protein [Candidatus Nitrosopelagicus sp.]|nr:HYR domain-containing protein [Candidatus Nitrosopelagicus sp.]
MFLLLTMVAGFTFNDVFGEVPPPIETTISLTCSGAWYDGPPDFAVTSDNTIFAPAPDGKICKVTSNGESTSMDFTDVLNSGYANAFHMDHNDHLFFESYDGGWTHTIYKSTQDGFYLLNFENKDDSGFLFDVREIRTDYNDNIYVRNQYDDILKFNPAGIYVETLHFENVDDINRFVFDPIGNLYYYVRTLENTFQLNKVSPNGNIVTLIEDHPIYCLRDIEIDSIGNIYVTTCPNNIDISSAKYDPNGELLFKFETNTKPEYDALRNIEIGIDGKIYALKDKTRSVHVFRDKFIEDNVPPLIEPIDDIVSEATSSSGNSVTFSTTAMDAIDGTMEVVCTPESGSVFPVGVTIPVTCTSTDYSFNSDYVIFDVRVDDSTPPTISSTSDMISTSYLDSTKIGYSIPTAIDNMGISGSVLCDPPPNSLFSIGTTTVTCSVSDISGNVGTSSFLIEIERIVPPVDNTPPTISIPNNIAVGTNIENSQPVSFSVTATDDMDGTVTPTCTHNSGSNFPIGTTTVTCSVSDHAGNSDSKSFTVTVNYILELTYDYLPTRDDIGYEWQFPTNKQVYNELEDSRGMYPDEYPGFAEYSWGGYMKGSGYSTNFLDLYVYRFLDSGYAEDFFEDHVDYWKGRGGFSSWTPSDGTVSSDECFGREVIGMTTDKISLYCIKNEIVIFATTTGFAFEMTDELSNFADSVFDHMPNNSQTNTSVESDPVESDPVESDPVESDPVESDPVYDDIDPEFVTDDEIFNDTEYKIELHSDESTYQTDDVLKTYATFFPKISSAGQYLIKDSQGKTIESKTFVPRSDGMFKIQESIDALWESGKYTLEVNWESKQEIFSFYVQQIVIDESNMILDSEPDTEKDILESTTYETKSKLSFVDDSKDPQSYVDRYNNESTYKEWFDENYPDYTIHEAVGLPEPAREKVPKWVKNNAKWWSDGEIEDDTFVSGIQHLMKEKIVDIPDLPAQTSEKTPPSFVDDSKDPQSYVDRYNNESTYKEWFDENYPDYTIEEAVGVTQPIPAWIKNTANWWSEGMISEDEFIKGIEFLVEKRILNVN